MDKEAIKYKKALEKLTEKVERVISGIDTTMKEPSSVKRGEKIAIVANYLAMANDIAMHSGLGWGFKKIENFKKRINQ